LTGRTGKPNCDLHPVCRARRRRSPGASRRGFRR